MRVTIPIVLALFLFAVPLPSSLAQAQGTPAAPAPAANGAANPPNMLIPVGTGILIKLSDELKSGSTPVGATVHFEVEKDVVQPGGAVLVPKGTPVFGQVTESKKAAIFGQPGKLSFTCDYLVLASGQQVALSPQPVNNRGDDERRSTVLSAVMDNWTDGLTAGGNVKVKKGQEFTVYVDHDTSLVPAAQPATAPTSAVAPGPSVAPAAIGTGKHVIVTLNDGSSYYGTVAKLDSGVYTLQNSQGTVQVKAADIKTVQYPDN